MSASYLYFIQAGFGGPVRVGFAGDPEKRMRGFQTAHYLRLHLLGAFPVENACRFEQALHRALASWRLAGEWFDRAAAVPCLSYLLQCQEEGLLIDWPRERTALAIASGALGLDELLPSVARVGSVA